MLSSEIAKRYEIWSQNPFFSPETREELKSIKGDTREITERFYKYLEFGTGGLRGIIGAGTNRINVYTVALATEGFARYVDTVDAGGKQKLIVISYDSRKFSKEFAMITALVFANHGIKVLLSDRLRPTPMLSYAVRYYGATGGVMITASHNPPQYNGYKAYGSDGGQMPPQAADTVLRCMKSIEDITELKWMDEKEAFDKGLVEYFGPELDEAYYKTLTDLIINRQAILDNKDFKIVYTPLHGAGHIPVVEVLRKAGFKNVLVVKEQAEPDPAFSTVKYPNPEEAEALSMAVDLAKKENSDLVLATDPDGDRTGLALRKKDGEFITLSGNQIGVLLMEYILSAKKKSGTLGDKAFVVTTIVSTKLTRRIAAEYGVKLFEVLTGFKFIGEKIKEYDEEGDMSFEFAFEESFGYLAGKDVRDKDGVVSVMLISEMAAAADLEGKTLYDLLEQIFRKYGYAAEKTVSFSVEGKEGLEKIRACMDNLRNNRQKNVFNLDIKTVTDYLSSEKVIIDTGEITPIDFEKSNVLIYSLDGDDWFGVRPSGTEPKLKIYFGAYADSQEEADKKLKDISEKVGKHIKELL